MHLTSPAIVCAARPHGETAVVARVLTAGHGLVAGYVAGGRGRRLRPLLIPGNGVVADLAQRSDMQLPFLRLELVESRAPWLSEPLPAAAIAWTTSLVAAALPERQPFPALYDALGALLDAVCLAPAARGWTPGLLDFERLMLRDLGYGAGPQTMPEAARDATDWPALLGAFDALGHRIGRHLLAERPLAVRSGGVMAARAVLRDRLARIG